jgi:hypothetical protein
VNWTRVLIAGTRGKKVEGRLPRKRSISAKSSNTCRCHQGEKGWGKRAFQAKEASRIQSDPSRISEKTEHSEKDMKDWEWTGVMLEIYTG